MPYIFYCSRVHCVSVVLQLLVQQLTAQVEALQMEVEAARSEPSIKDE